MSVPPASEAEIIAALEAGDRAARTTAAFYQKHLTALEARVEVELELRKAAYERIAALEARLAEAERVIDKAREASIGDEISYGEMIDAITKYDLALPPESDETVTGGKGGLSWRERTGIEPSESAEG